MAGTLPNSTGYRFKLDEDGTVLFGVHGTTYAIEDLTSSLASTQDLSLTTYAGPTDHGTQQTIYWFLFPEPRTITGVYALVTPSVSTASQKWEYSTDTTTGTDGTWTSFTSQAAGAMVFSDTGTEYRTLASTAFSPIYNVKAIRFTPTANTSNNVYRLATFFVNGFLPTSSIDRMEFWDSSTDTRMSASALDFGDVTNGTTTGVKQFRIKNLSTTKTSSGTTIEWGPTNSPTINHRPDSVELSLDGTTWASSVTVTEPGQATGVVTPGGISSIISVRATVSGTAPHFAQTAYLRTTNTSYA